MGAAARLRRSRNRCPRPRLRARSPSLTARSYDALPKQPGGLRESRSAGGLPLVTALLGLGVDPDIQDAGGQTPLYSVVNECPAGAPIGRVLLQSAATIDACGGCHARHPAPHSRPLRQRRDCRRPARIRRLHRSPRPSRRNAAPPRSQLPADRSRRPAPLLRRVRQTSGSMRSSVFPAVPERVLKAEINEHPEFTGADPDRYPHPRNNLQTAAQVVRPPHARTDVVRPSTTRVPLLPASQPPDVSRRIRTPAQSARARTPYRTPPGNCDTGRTARPRSAAPECPKGRTP